MAAASQKEIISRLKQDLLVWEGFKRSDADKAGAIGMGSIEDHFPEKVFPKGHIHEMISYQPESAVASNGFISAITGKLLGHSGFCVWVSAARTIFPPTLALFGIPPEQVIFADVRTQKEALWTIEEALKCEALTVVIGEVSELSFGDSRRLQLAVEKSRVTGFIHRNNPRTENTTACVTRWKVEPLTSTGYLEMPGIGFPCWDIHLVKVRNGQPGNWQVEWNGTFCHLQSTTVAIPQLQKRKTG